jgi:hypothetical protein
MTWFPAIRVVLFSGTFLLIMNAVLDGIIRACSYVEYCFDIDLPALARIHFILHPVTNRLFNALVITFFLGENTASDQHHVIKAIIFHIFSLLEGFIYGVLLAMVVNIVLKAVIELIRVLGDSTKSRNG